MKKVQAKTSKPKSETGSKAKSETGSEKIAVQTHLELVLENIKPLVKDNIEAKASCSVSGCEAEMLCDKGWFFEQNQAKRCSNYQVYLEQKALLKSFLDLDMSKYQKAWNDLELTHNSWRIIQSYCLQANTNAFVAHGLQLMLYGPKGTGKSQALIKLVEATRREDFKALFINWSAWWMRVKATYKANSKEDESSLLEQLIAPDFLALDEIGTGLDADSPRLWSLLEQLIATRYDNLKATAITTNLSREEFAVMSTRLSKDIRSELLRDVRDGKQDIRSLPSRLFSRINTSAHWIPFDGTSFREEEDQSRITPIINQVLADAGILEDVGVLENTGILEA